MGSFLRLIRLKLRIIMTTKSKVSGKKVSLAKTLDRFKEVHGNKYDYSLITEETYKNATTKVKIICPVHGVFEQRPYAHYNGQECKECSLETVKRKLSLTYEEFLERSQSIHEGFYDYSLIDKDNFLLIKSVNIICPVHGVFEQNKNSHILGKGCRRCGYLKTNPSSTTEEFIKKAAERHNNRYDYSLVEYTTNKSRVKIICKDHGVFEQRPDNHLMGQNCPVCGSISRATSTFSYPSKLETKIAEFLDSKNIEYITSDREILGGQELDILIPSKNIAIECNGLYWHSELYKTDKNYHLDKTLNSEKKDIQLLHLWENEINDKFDKVCSIIESKLGISENRIYARKCYIKLVDTKDATKFQEDNHLQGSVGSRIKLGLFYQDELVSLMTFGIPRFNTNYKFELLRFCSLKGYSVVGGASKLFRYFVNNYMDTDDKIISYANRRISNGNLYRKLGFTELAASEPSYFYHGVNGTIYQRYQAQKHKLKSILGENFNPTLTEKENMNNNGYYRVYDCGNLVFEYKKGLL